MKTQESINAFVANDLDEHRDLIQLMKITGWLAAAFNSAREWHPEITNVEFAIAVRTYAWPLHVRSKAMLQAADELADGEAVQLVNALKEKRA